MAKFCGYGNFFYGYGIFTVVHGHGHVGIFYCVWLWEKFGSCVWTCEKFLIAVKFLVGALIFLFFYFFLLWEFLDM